MDRKNNFDDLSSLLSDDKISDAEAIKRFSHMRQQLQHFDELRSHYEGKIKTRKDDGRVYVYVHRKQYIAPTVEQLYEILYQLHYSKEKASLADLYPQWLTWRKDCSSACDKTIKEDMAIWNKYFADETLSKIPLADVSVKNLIDLFRKWTHNRAMTRKQFNNVKSVLNGIYYYAVEENIVAHNPCRDINYKQFSFKPVNHQSDVFTLADRQALLDYLSDKTDLFALAIRLDFQLVLRIGELLALRWSDIKDGNIYIQSQLLATRKVNADFTLGKTEYVTQNHVKGNTAEGFRYQPLTDEAKHILAEIRKLNPDGEFILMENGCQLRPERFNRWLKRYCEKCGINARTSHKIRFCGASLLYDADMPLPELQRLLGHTTTAMTLHYLRNVTPSEATSALMNKVLSQS